MKQAKPNGIRGRVLAMAALAILTTNAALAAQPQPAKPNPSQTPRWTIVIHGGAGVMDRDQMTPQTRSAYEAALSARLKDGAAVLERGGSALDAIEVVIQAMEDDPLFNAGRGAVFTAEGRNELDAAIMDGATRKAGAVAGLTTTRHPISAARKVIEASPHVMLMGANADAFAASVKLEQVPNSYFFTERRWKGLAEVMKEKGLPMPPRPAGAPAADLTSEPHMAALDERKFGTVGVVALDQNGNIAAGTSTGGTTGKRWGRVGDTPIIGAGTYADNASCAVSATGTGEFFIRRVVAHEICALVKYKGLTLQQAADTVVHDQLMADGGDGGIIAVTRDGQAVWSFNTPGMYRARQIAGQKPEIGIFKED